MKRGRGERETRSETTQFRNAGREETEGLMDRET